MKTIFNRAALAAAVCAAAIAAPAQAEEAKAEPFVGVSAGWHDSGAGVPRDSGPIYGVFAGVDVPVSGNLFVGVEGNYHFGSKAIDSEYGASARLGLKTDFGKVYVRGGYQEVNFDLAHIAGAPVPAGLDDTGGDYLVGIGTDINLGSESNVALRLNLDTIAFDSTRATVGVAVKF
jgi:hypothetical protein